MQDLPRNYPPPKPGTVYKRMEQGKRKTTMKGGARTKKKITMGDQALLQAIWDKHGGPGEVAEKVSAFMREPLHNQAPINWRTRGRVPYRYVKAVSEALDISPLGLNYGVLATLAVKVPTWDEVVRKYGLDEQTIDAILFLKPPGLPR